MDVKITKENYKGYIELYKYYRKIDFPETKIFRKTLCLITICTILSSLMSYFNLLYSFCFGTLANTTIIIGGFVNTRIKRIKIKNELKNKYPNIDYSINEKELGNLLEKNNILQYNSKTNTYYIDENGYFNKNIEKELEYRYNMDDLIAHCEEHEMPSAKEKQKVKILNYKR